MYVLSGPRPADFKERCLFHHHVHMWTSQQVMPRQASFASTGLERFTCGHDIPHIFTSSMFARSLHVRVIHGK